MTLSDRIWTFFTGLPKAFWKEKWLSQAEEKAEKKHGTQSDPLCEICKSAPADTVVCREGREIAFCDKCLAEWEAEGEPSFEDGEIGHAVARLCAVSAEHNNINDALCYRAQD